MTCLFICRVFLWDDLQWRSVQNDRSHKSYCSVMKTHYESHSHLRLIESEVYGKGYYMQGILLLWAPVTHGALEGVQCLRKRVMLNWFAGCMCMQACVSVCVCVQSGSPMYLVHPALSDSLQRVTFLIRSPSERLQEKQQLFFLLMWNRPRWLTSYNIN